MAPSLLCRTCGQPATHVHFIPWPEEPERVELACADHDPGDEWFTLDELASGPAGWLRTCQRSATPAPEALTAWLGSLTGQNKPSEAPTAQPPADGPLSVKEAAEREKCDEKTIYRMLQAGVLGDGAWKMGSRWRIDPDALTAARAKSKLPQSRQRTAATVTKKPTGMEDWPDA